MANLDDGWMTLLAVGAPNSGKTEFALNMLLDGIGAYGADRALMAVSGRKAADSLSDRVIRAIGTSPEARPVTTLSAIAFRLIAAVRRRAGQSAPRLLNGAEQDALLRRVTAAHVRHAMAGESAECPTCGLLAHYFASDRWADLVMRPDADTADGATDALFERGMSDAFVDQLRDMLARMNELGASQSREEEIIAALTARTAPDAPVASTLRVSRLTIQWRLAFALRREYVAAIGAKYPGEYRLDSSRLLVEGTTAVERLGSDDLPRLAVVDDVQDLTLAGLAFVSALRDAGCRLALVGCPDESVQSFRGSYPEYMLAAIRSWDGVRSVRIEHGETVAENADTPDTPSPVSPITPRYLDLVSARVSLSILSPEPDSIPVPKRAGKLPVLPGAWPIAPQTGYAEDRSLTCALYRSPREEVDDVVWRIKRAHLDGRDWNDMAVIAHDNATVRLIGERLRRDGVPVAYSSVTRPLKDEPFVAGLFAVVELARLRDRGIGGLGMEPGQAAGYVRSRVAAIMDSPLVAVGATDRNEGYPARLSVAESAMDALQSLAAVIGRDALANAAATQGDEAAKGGLPRLMVDWRHLRERFDAARMARATAATSRIDVDDAVYDGLAGQAAEPDADDRGGSPDFGRDALYLMLAFDPDAAADALAAIHAVCGSRPGQADGHAEAFERVWRIVGDTARSVAALSNREAQYVLAAAWAACGVDRRWQRLALANTEAGRAANDRLDVAMRLFQFAADSTADRDIMGFIDQVRAMQVEADSLAHVAPVEQAVTLTTPAGAAGRHWDLVWIPTVQQDVWPNLASRNTMFGGEDLADVMLRGRLTDMDAPAPGAVVRSPRLASVLYAETKSLLVALTRARSAVHLSAVMSDELAPSDFLYDFLPERYARGDKPVYTQVGDGGAYAGLDADPRGLVTAARVALVRAAMGSDACPDGDADTAGRDAPAVEDAAETLALLASHGVTSADPGEWAFVPRPERASVIEHAFVDGHALTDEHSSGRLVTLSPSAVDGLWACPVCWLLENRFAGPRREAAAAGFGTIMHAVAQQASAEGLDMPGAGLSSEAIAERMRAIYDELKPDVNAIDDVRERYIAARHDADAAGMIANIAAYFADSNAAGYPPKNEDSITVGRLERADCEMGFSARFGFDDILAAYNAIDGMTPIDRPTLMAIMGALVGGWPEAIGDDLTIRLAGRIDRAETRVTADGSTHVRLIDYKTGHKPGIPQLFGDLQLVCYQLGLTFPEGGPRGAQALRKAPAIAQSALFHVAENPYPATSYGAESAYQPPLFTGGSLNATGFAPRYFFKDMKRLFDSADVLPETPPQGVDAADWERFTGLRGTHAVWALTMISRVFYAAAASVSARIVARPQPDHQRHCRCLGVCPACSGEMDTVYEVQQAK
ncbi:PD-(D/E)XK nuclease family protein [Bifidobacterium vespertilionis]|uniref:UvrD-like helicase C-terminal domain-containing protein n=1 Tax=Bifidobacterium vespertilionis TaxID=2562524 RepID=A0A5J5DUE4_9BIFI|nr:PD-(D/E)XK nuclease family protein [Bifidobacterium vespertilionis]KAA8819280.1 hypothetical protein EMO90_08550 [Bifidobacterium vespertilionis]KAA8823188.1 hypothetical protein EM848_06680 [Bifidobacterium vespertilionis]